MGLNLLGSYNDEKFRDDKRVNNLKSVLGWFDSKPVKGAVYQLEYMTNGRGFTSTVNDICLELYPGVFLEESPSTPKAIDLYFTISMPKSMRSKERIASFKEDIKPMTSSVIQDFKGNIVENHIIVRHINSTPEKVNNALSHLFEETVHTVVL